MVSKKAKTLVQSGQVESVDGDFITLPRHFLFFFLFLQSVEKFVELHRIKEGTSTLVIVQEKIRHRVCVCFVIASVSSD
jgi:hypothetical protein